MLESALTTLLLGAQLIAQPAPPYHIEREPVADGAELVTVFAHTQKPGAEMPDVPVLSVLRDTLGDNDPENDRLRYVWVLTSTRPTPIQRVASTVSFAYFRAGSQEHADRVPKLNTRMASWLFMNNSCARTCRAILRPMASYCKDSSNASGV